MCHLIILLLFLKLKFSPFYLLCKPVAIAQYILLQFCIRRTKKTQQLCTCMFDSLFPSLCILMHLLSALSLFLPQTWITQRTTSNHNRPDHTRLSPVTHPPPPLPLSSSLAGCIHQHSAIISFSSNLLCWSVNITPPPLGPDRRPRGSTRWSSKLCLAMPQVREMTEEQR